MEKINVAEILENCPKGIELDCTLYDNIVLDSVNMNYKEFPIKIKRADGGFFTLTKYGQITNADFAKCIIFPKGKTTWEGFQKPFVNGDIVTCKSEFYKEKQIFIFKEYTEQEWRGNAICHVFLDVDGTLHVHETPYYVRDYATEQEKEKLFEALAQVGCKWNEAEKKIENINTSLIPIFNVGDEVHLKNDNKIKRIIDNVFHNCYTLKGYGVIHFKDQNDWEISKFDIKSLKPFDKVLVRDCDTDKWHIDFFEEYN